MRVLMFGEGMFRQADLLTPGCQFSSCCDAGASYAPFNLQCQNLPTA